MTEMNPFPTQEEALDAVDSGASASPRVDTITRQAVLAAQNLAINAVLFAALGVALAIQSGGAWQAIHFIILSSQVIVTGFVSAALIRRGQPQRGAWILYASDWIAPVWASLLVVNLGYVAAAYILVAHYFIIRYVMPRKTQRTAWALTAVGVIISILAEVLSPSWRLASSLMLTITPILTGLLGTAFLVIIARQVWGVSMRNKLLVAFIGVTLVATGALAAYMYTSTTNLLQNSLETQLTQHTDGITVSINNLIHEQVTTLTALSLNEVLQQSVETSNAEYTGDATAIQAQMNAKDAQWQAADAANNNADPLVQKYLTNEVALDLIEFQRSFPEHLELFITDVYGGLVGTTNRTSDYYQADEDWWQAAYNNGDGAVYISNPIFDASTGQLGIQIALPLKSRATGEVVGVLRTTFNANELFNILEESIGQTGETDLLIPGETVTHFHEGGFSAIELEEFEQVQAFSGQGMVDMDYEGVPSVVIVAPVTSPAGDLSAERLGWLVVFHQQHAEAFAPVNEGIQGVLVVVIIVIVFAIAAAYFLAQLLIRPISHLTTTAEEVSAGNLDRRAEVTSTDEVGTLASAFNSMTSQLQETLQGLEQRVAARTQDLELAAEVGRSVSQVRKLDVMLRDACQLILEQFDLYYVQVYLTNPSQTELQLQAGTGEVGTQLLERGHSLPLNTGSLNGRAAVERRPVVISDTTLSTTFRKNPLLPETRGEMAMPLMVGEQVVGVLDMQSSQPGVLNEEVLPAFEALAGQLAVAIQNATLLAEAEQARAEVEAQARRQVRASWGEHLDAIHKPEHIGFMFDRNEVLPFSETETVQAQESEQTLSSPIYLSGEPLGSLVVEIDDEERKEQISELVTIVARQVAQQIENLRLLESAERYRFEADQAARRQTIEGWQAYIASRKTDSLGYLYDLNEVRPHSNGQDDVGTLTLPLRARDETVGRLAVQGLVPDDRESFDLANAVAERLGAHIENLRLFEETRRGQMELDRRAQQLAAVAQVSTASSQEMDVQKMLETVVHLTQRQFGLYHAHVFTYREESGELQIVACGYKEGDEHEGTHGTTTIPVTQEQSLVARAARTRQAVIVNDVHNEPGWLPNPLLPETRAELAVPMIVGDKLLGVLDVQSEHLNAFSVEDANIQLTLASQVAIALQNAYSFAQAQRQAEREGLLNTINQKIQSATSVEAVLQIAARELGHALGAPMTIAQLSMKDQK